jgi:predicted RNase H-like HicB family nuclease
MTRTLTATIWREDDGYVALCSELDIASQGDSIEEARSNLKEAVELFFEMAHSIETSRRLNVDNRQKIKSETTSSNRV